MRSGKVAAAFAVLLVVSFAVMNAMPSDTLPAALLQEAVLALVAFAAVGSPSPMRSNVVQNPCNNGIPCVLRRPPCS